MDKKRSSIVPYVMIAVLGTAIACLLFYILPFRYKLNQTIEFKESGKELFNPLTGYAPPAESLEECADRQLVYIGITWAEWEPRQDEYAVEALEEKYHIRKWKEENKNAVIRFLCDVPGEEGHKDIPEWLYQKTKDGEFYNTSYGSGYSPDYGDSFFRERHRMAMEALAEYCNQDDFAAYVELGSLGHWGEWHTNTSEGVPALPGADICWQYVLDYSDQFHNARLLMRRNYIMVAEGGLGLYNDMTGQTEDTEEWLDWMKNGGSFETAGLPLEYRPLEEFWNTAPVGGEFTSAYSMEELLGDRLEETRDLVKRSHMTFIGPKCPEGDMAQSAGARDIRQNLGYRFYISEMNTRYSFGSGNLHVQFTWRNTGQAPLYWDWPVTMYVYNQAGELEYWESMEIDLSRLAPGEELVSEADIPFGDDFRQGYRIGIRVTDPDQEQEIALAMDCEELDGVQIIYTYEGE